MNPGSIKTCGVWIILLAMIWSLGLGTRALTRPDEGRYAEIGREMAVSGDWVTPHLNGIPYYEKPPLQYWATALSIDLLGPTPLAARLWTGLLGFLGILASAFFARRLFGTEAGWRAPLLLIGTFYYTALGHINTLDMGVTVWMFLAVGCFLLAQQESSSRLWMTLAWGAAAAGFMSKGLMALALPGATLVLYTLFTRDLSPWKRLHLFPGLLLFLLLTLPWFWLASRVHPEFLWFFFVHEQFDRYTTTLHQRVEPVWYFLPILLVGLWPWTLVALRATGNALLRNHGRHFSPARFLAIYALFVVVFFSLSGSKLPDYILPAFPALALLGARQLSVRPGPFPLSPPLLLALGGAFFGVTALLLAFPALPESLGWSLGMDPDMVMGYQGFSTWIAAAAAVSLVLGYLAHRQRARPAHSLKTVAVGTLLVTQLLISGSNTLADFQSGAALARRLAPRFAAASHLYSVNTYDQTLDFYLQRTVIPVAYQDEMAFGLSLEPQHAIPTLKEFRPLWAADLGALAILPPPLYDVMKNQGFPMRILFRDAHRVIVART
ncbi:glycosyltransferase family 39 protein [Ferrovum sp.]|uniref:glycosyltransferase family 39 protein n=1 Tax=Ferrovum sp. TaxID=2609467 RepID=UPI0026207195|nr:glycosyltransferase family 39 protein [Ferrovum sp.]